MKRSPTALVPSTSLSTCRARPSHVLAPRALPGAGADAEVTAAGSLVREQSPEPALDMVVPQKRRRSAANAAQLVKPMRHVPQQPLVGAWMSVEQAALMLGVPSVTLRRTLERNAHRGADGGVVVQVDGVHARKLGRTWRVWLDEGWRTPMGRTPAAQGHVEPPCGVARCPRRLPSCCARPSDAGRAFS
jgi:hypothetical protein